MNIAGGRPASMVNGASPTAVGPRHGKLPRIAGLALIAAFILFPASSLLPAALSQVALDLMIWCLVGALAAGTLFASVKLIESILDL